MMFYPNLWRLRSHLMIIKSSTNIEEDITFNVTIPAFIRLLVTDYHCNVGIEVCC